MADKTITQFCLSNARGLYAQLSHLHTLCSSSIDFLALTETHLDSSYPDSLFSPPGWLIFRKDRTKYGGGVALLIRDKFNCTVRSDLESKTGEDLWLDTAIGQHHVTIGIIYRPPGQSVVELNQFASELDQTLTKLTAKPNSTIILLGDFNAKCSDWLQGSPTNAAGTLLSDLLAKHDLYQVVFEITRPTGGQGLPSTDGSGTLLDLIITNKPGLLSTPTIQPPLGSSDHYSVHCSMDACIARQRRPLTRLWNVQKCDNNALLEDLLAQPWPNTTGIANSDIDSLWNDWHTIFMACVQKHVPSKLVAKVRPKPPWLNDVLLAECKLKKSLFRLSKSCPTPENISRFRQQRNKVTAMLRRAKTSSSTQSPPGKPGRSFWTLVRHYKGTRHSRPLPPLQHPDGSKASTDVEKANVLNDFFISQGSIPGRNDCPLSISGESCPEKLTEILITPAEVCRLLLRLKTDKAAGSDGIPNSLLRLAAPAISQSLAWLFQRSLVLGKLPLQWKTSKVVPVYKKGRRDQPDNYRPISLLPAVSKVLETIVNCQLYEHLQANALLSPFQSGFRRGDSTSLQLFRVVHQLMSEVDSGQVAAAVFYDFRKAFDTVWHAGLLQKLSDAGIEGSLHAWFVDYLTSRQQFVEVGCSRSTVGVPLAGVPQGSVLGPTLFILYINSITSTTKIPSNCFADDTSTIAFASSPERLRRHLQADIDSVFRWSVKHKLSLHPEKTVAMSFHHPNQKPQTLSLHLNGSPVVQVSSHKHLGIILSSAFTWTEHIDNISKKSLRMISILRHLRFHHHFAPKQLLLAYRVYIRPLLEYGSTTWSGLPASSIRRLQRIQNQALAIAGAEEDFLASLEDRRSAALSFLFYKILSDSVPPHLLGFCSWPLVSCASGRNLRNSTSVRLPRPKTSLLPSSPLYLACSAYNTSNLSRAS